MNTQTYLTTARLSAAGMLALMITACGSSGSSGTTTPASSVAASSSVPASSAAASSERVVASSEVAASSSVAAAAIAESCNVADGTYLACLDLEDVAPGAIPAGFNLTGSAAEVVEGEGAHSGTLALKVDSSKGAGFLTMSEFSGTHWGRLFYKNTAKPSAIPNHSHTSLVAAYDNGTHYRLVDMVAAPDGDNNKGKYQHLYNIDNASSIDLSLEGPYSHSYGDEWVCLEWQVSAVDQEYRVFFNGDELALANAGTASNSTDIVDAKRWDNEPFDFVPVPANFDEIKIGIQNYQGHAYSFLLDDIAISATERVGCEIVEITASSEMMSSSSVMSSAETSSSEMSSSSMMMSSSEMSSSSMMMSSSEMSSEAASSSAPAVVVGKADYDAMCVSCHTDAASISGGRDQAALAAYISATMPIGNVGACTGTCAEDTAAYILK